MAARTVLGPKPCSTQAPTVLNVRSSGSEHCRYSLLGLENLPEQIPQELQIPKAILYIGERHGNVVLRGFVDG